VDADKSQSRESCGFVNLFTKVMKKNEEISMPFIFYLFFSLPAAKNK
jgi:hypothetical protein